MLSFRLEGGWRQCQRAGSLQRAPHTCGCYAAKCAKHGQVIAGPQLSVATHTVWQKSATASCANRLAMRNSPRSAILLLRVIRVLHSLRNGDPGNKPMSRCPRCFCSQTAGPRAPLPAPPPARRPAPCALGPALAAARMSQNPPRFPRAVRLEPRHPTPHPPLPPFAAPTAQLVLQAPPRASSPGGRAGPAGWGAPDVFSLPRLPRLSSPRAPQRQASSSAVTAGPGCARSSPTPAPGRCSMNARSVRWGERSCKELQLILLG